MEIFNLRMKVLIISASVIILLSHVLSCNPSDTKLQQYKVEGEQLYLQHCSNCHQKNGKGLGLVYPPLDNSDYMDKNLEKVICLMKYGVASEMIVNGKSYHQPMPGVRSLTELELAEIATYIYNNWSHSKGIIDIPTVTAALQQCED